MARTIVFLHRLILALKTVAALSADSLPGEALPKFAQRQVGVPTASDYRRRAFQKSVVLGDHVYIVGGEISQVVNGETDTLPSSRQNNDTLSIDISRSWTNETVDIRTIQNGNAPVFNLPTLWPDRDSTSFYLWGGQTWPSSPLSSTPDLALWQFTANGAGGGSWSKQSPSDSANFSKLTRPYGATTATGQDVGYALNGVMTSHSDPGFAGDGVPLSGLVSFNMTSGSWSNDSSIGYSSDGIGLWGHMQYVPNFGTDGLLMLVGGQSISPTLYLPQAYANENPTFIPFDTVTIYDPASKTWYSQATTGEQPSLRDSFCAVGVQGDDNTYEIFVHGGWNPKEAEAYDEVYVLTIPGFAWFKASYTPTSPRTLASCNVVGKRQMLIVGGMDLSVGSNKFFRHVDPWRNGLGVFDMSAMAWASEYNAGAAAYESPVVVKEWYNRGALSSVTWTSPKVRDMFMKGDAIKSSTTSNNPASPSSSSAATSHKISPGAIAGIVVAGVVVLAVIAAIFILVRRRNRRVVDHAPPSYSTGWSDPELDGSASAHPVPRAELGGEQKPPELGGVHMSHELPS